MIRTIAELFYEAVDHQSLDAMFYKHEGAFIPLSHGAIQESVERLALGLRREGLATGDRVAILSENRPEWAFADYACAILGVVTAPVYPTLNAVQSAYIIRHSGAKLIFCSSAAQLEKVLGVWDTLPGLEALVLMEGEAPVVEGRRILGWGDFLAAGAERGPREQVRAWARERIAGDLLTLIYTSGTTGEPKGAMLTHGNLVSNILDGLKLLKLTRGQSCLSILPLSHIFERMAGHYVMFFCGVRIFYLDDLNNLPQAFLDVRPEVLLAVPRVYEKVYARIREAVNGASLFRRFLFHWALWVGRKVARRRFEGKAPGLLLGPFFLLADRLVLGKVRARLGGRIEISASGGAALLPMVMEFFWAAGVPIFEGYGLSETSPILTLTVKDLVRPGYVGRPILEQWEGRPFLKLSEDGEILCQGPNVTPGYWNDPAATAAAFDEEGYFCTGDIGSMDAEGRLTITDRKKEILVTSSGKNVAPQPIERLLITDKYIAQAVIIGDRRNFISAIIVANLGTLRRWAERKNLPFASDAELVARPEVIAKVMSRIGRLNEQLSNYERVRKIILLSEEMTLDSGLLTPSLKVKRRAVDEKYAKQIQGIYGAGL